MSSNLLSLIHASCVSLDGRGVLLMGPSGAGKSDLALRLMDRGFELVSDDQTEVFLEGENVMARPPENIAGLIEVRGAGLLRVNWAQATLALCVHLCPVEAEYPRLPEPEFERLQGKQIPKVTLPAFAASTALKIEHLLTGVFENVD